MRLKRVKRDKCEKLNTMRYRMLCEKVCTTGDTKEVILAGKEQSLDLRRRLVVLWEEDDARAPGRETGREAFKRITQRSPDFHVPLLRVDLAESHQDMFTVYHDGWVIGHTPEGDYVGVLVDVEFAGTGETV